MQKCPVGAEVKRRTEAANRDHSPSFLAAGSEIAPCSLMVFWRSSPFCTSTGEVEEEARRSEKKKITLRSDFIVYPMSGLTATQSSYCSACNSTNYHHPHSTTKKNSHHCQQLSRNCTFSSKSFALLFRDHGRCAETGKGGRTEEL